MQNVLITGANRGIGLGFAQHYLEQGAQVFACSRHGVLPKTLSEHKNCHAITWDVQHALDSKEHNKLPSSLNLLINNAGVYGSKSGKQNLLNIDEHEMAQVFSVNAITPIRVVQTLLPRLKKGQLLNDKAVIANMSSKMGSSADNDSGGTYAYRASKAALCVISKSMAMDLADDHIQVICLHPGWVQTDMTNQTGLIDVATSVAGLSDVIERIDQYPAGSFVAYDGAIVPY